jgi:hypothetical protein
MKKKALLILAVLLIIILLIYAFDKVDLIGDPAKGVVKDPEPPFLKCSSSDTVEINCRKFPHLIDFRKIYVLNPKHYCLCKDDRVLITHQPVKGKGKRIHGFISGVIGHEKDSCK